MLASTQVSSVSGAFPFEALEADFRFVSISIFGFTIPYLTVVPASLVPANLGLPQPTGVLASDFVYKYHGLETCMESVTNFFGNEFDLHLTTLFCLTMNTMIFLYFITLWSTSCT